MSSYLKRFYTLEPLSPSAIQMRKDKSIMCAQKGSQLTKSDCAVHNISSNRANCIHVFSKLCLPLASMSMLNPDSAMRKCRIWMGITKEMREWNSQNYLKAWMMRAR